MTAVKSVTLPEFLTEEQIAQAIVLYRSYGGMDAADEICAQLIVPNMETINAKLGQANDARYLAYAVVYVLSNAQEPEFS